jgi:hypothetical protein
MSSFPVAPPCKSLLSRGKEVSGEGSLPARMRLLPPPLSPPAGEHSSGGELSAASSITTTSASPLLVAEALHRVCPCCSFGCCQALVAPAMGSRLLAKNTLLCRLQA